MLSICGANKRLAGDSVTVEATVVPVPVRLTVWVPALPVTLRVPVAEPVAVGLNETRTVQAPPGAIAALQLLV